MPIINSWQMSILIYTAHVAIATCAVYTKPYRVRRHYTVAACLASTLNKRYVSVNYTLKCRLVLVNHLHLIVCREWLAVVFDTQSNTTLTSWMRDQIQKFISTMYFLNS